ncbi:methyltransferase regulatory domain-containing protein [Neopusillimonas aromaticivorans]|uniref:methyltransferase regulatory domain-containing protein n=1 Tax=Neopusillimonas aromaticivorans TaxID=2979868 RepID=UPI002592E0AA|nr:methyltransferase regulatory domain-containing protein [Neopusillimonas aromaticivorans]WJJ93305.1 methyltransferase regulatory domain-containing protein [Neopusillimonas aromaticivorans]
METFNNPCYLLEFVNMADQHGLTHVGDAEPHVEMSVTFGQNVQLNHSLVALGQPREMRQQYLDFAVGRNFRKSMLVHQARAGEVTVSPDMERLADLRWAGHFTEVESPAEAPKDSVALRNHKNRLVQTSDTAVLAVMRTLTAVWPASMDFQTLLVQTRPELEDAEDDEAARKKLLEALQTLFRLNFLRFTLDLSAYETQEAIEQDAPALIPGFSHIYQQRKNPEFGVGTFNLWHEAVNLQLKEAEAFVLHSIDGNRNRKQLATLLRDALHRGDVPYVDGKFLKGQRNLDSLADKVVGKLLGLLKQQGVLF